MLSCSLFLAMTIAFPASGQKLAYAEKAYMIGAVERGVTNIVVSGANVEVYRTGAWGTLVDVAEGTNTIQIVNGNEITNHVFHVAAKPRPKPASPSDAALSTNKPPEKIWKKLDYCADEPKPHPNGKPPAQTLIVLDPGHGGSDTGAVSPHGLYEKNANLLLANAVKRELEQKGYRVLMTRESDVALALHDRPRLAHAEGADAFISIHHNAPGIASDPIAARHCAVYSWNEIGERLSVAIVSRIEAAFDGEIPSKGSLHANFAVTRNPEIPSCLVEADFITSPAGEENIFSIEGRRHFASAIAQGIDDWCNMKDEKSAE